MSYMSDHHRTLTDGVGKCSVPIFGNNMPAGFCDRKAYGEQPSTGPHYAPGLACPSHGGPPLNQITPPKAMTDPTAIDLKAYRYHEGVMRAAHEDHGNSYAGLAAGFIHNLIAEVEVLRERLGKMEDKAGPFHERYRWKERAETAEAHATELTTVLEQVQQRCLFEEDLGAIGVTTEPHIDEKLFSDICTALATLPAQALERHKALEDCVVVLRCYTKNEIGDVILQCLEKLDALTPENGA